MAEIHALHGGVSMQDGEATLIDQEVIDGLEKMLEMARSGEINGVLAIGMKSLGKCRHDIPMMLIGGVNGVAQNTLAYMGAMEMMKRDICEMVEDFHDVPEIG